MMTLVKLTVVNELPAELGLIVEQICRAHRETFPSLDQLGKYTTVSPDMRNSCLLIQRIISFKDALYDR